MGNPDYPQITQISQSAAEPQPKSIDESAVADGSIKPGAPAPGGQS